MNGRRVHLGNSFFGLVKAGLVTTALSVVACGGSNDDHDANTKPDDGTGRQATALEDVEFGMGAHIGAGVETQKCVYVAMPADRGVIAVPSAESHYTPGSHHFLVYRTGKTEVPEGGGEIHECGAAELINDLQGTYYEAQRPDDSRTLPDGVAHLFQPGEVLLLTSHYLNTTEEDIDASMTFTLHTIDAGDVDQEAGSIFFYNYNIALPPNSQTTVRRTCPIPEEMNLAILWSHMHWRGTGFRAKTDDAAIVDRIGDLYDSETWNEPPPRDFPNDPPVTLHAGATVTYECDFSNDTAETVVQGPSAETNEMCILHGMYWPRQDPSVELCLQGK
jgi:hypothetical protein